MKYIHIIVIFISIFIITTACSNKLSVQNKTFSEKWIHTPLEYSYSQSYYFTTTKYIQEITENDFGKHNTRIIEEGKFIQKNNKCFLFPEIIFFCSEINNIKPCRLYTYGDTCYFIKKDTLPPVIYDSFFKLKCIKIKFEKENTNRKKVLYIKSNDGVYKINSFQILDK